MEKLDFFGTFLTGLWLHKRGRSLARQFNDKGLTI